MPGRIWIARKLRQLAQKIVEDAGQNTDFQKLLQQHVALINFLATNQQKLLAGSTVWPKSEGC